MITYQQLEEAERRYPMPEYVGWYHRDFPSRKVAFIGAALIIAGMIFTIAKVSRIHLLSITLQIISLIIWLCLMLLIAVFKKRTTFKRRAEYLGITLQEYLKYDVVDSSITSKILRWYEGNYW